MTELPPDESELIDSAKAGDIDAFTTLLERYYDRIYRYAFKWLGNPTDAEDIAQEVSIKFANQLKNFRQDSQLSTWLYRITINCANDLLRQRKAQQTTPLEPELTALVSQAETQDTEAVALWQLVQTLPDKQRDAVLLVYAQGHNHREAAEILACKESTVSWYIHQAKKQLINLVDHHAG